ncbi:MAG: hypothetical protein RL518_2362 [Pseudomonadota bacterium]|jgi:RimJ/RimL family protein N-acetyltransferase
MSQRQEISIRDARIEDAEILLAWRNDPEARSMFVSQDQVSPEEHVTWLRETLERDDRVLLMGSLGDHALVGVVRFDIDRSRRKINVSININPAMRRMGLSSKLLEAAIASLKDRVKGPDAGFALEAQIRHENKASLRCFQRVGFTQAENDEHFYYLRVSLT